MKLLYIINGLGFSRGAGIGGADKRALEIGKRLFRHKFKVSVLTTTSGYEALEREGLKAQYFQISPPFFWFSRMAKTLLGRTISYIYATLKSFFLPLPINDYDIVYATSDFFFDIFPARYFKKKAKKIKFAAMIHHRIDIPWKRQGNIFLNFLLFISQKLSFNLLRKWADLIFVYDTPEGRKVQEDLTKRGFPKEKVILANNGVDYKVITSIPHNEIKYDACFVGGIRPSKGIFDIVPIWAKVCQHKKDTRLIIIGGGTTRYVQDLKKEIAANHLSKNIMLGGPLFGRRLFETMKSCRLFISPSYEEGWGIAVCEAMSCGLPVVAYNLPAYEIFKEAIEKVPLGNVTLFAERILNTLQEENIRLERGKVALDIARRFDWDVAARKEFTFLKGLVNRQGV